MIRLTEKTVPGEAWLLPGPAALRLLCTERVYAGCPFFSLWVQDRPPGLRSAYLSALDSAYTLIAGPNADFAELKGFLIALGAETVFCDSQTGSFLGWKSCQENMALRLERQRSPARPPILEGELQLNPSPGRIYETLAACEGEALRLPDRLAFHADLSHRFRHGGGRALLLESGGRDLACAVALESDAGAYISGVAVRPECQRKGLGGSVLFHLLQMLQAEYREIWTLTRGETLPFYQKWGFVPAGAAGWFIPPAQDKTKL